MNSIVVGMGEVGTALHSVLVDAQYSVWEKDVEPLYVQTWKNYLGEIVANAESKEPPEGDCVLHICLNNSREWDVLAFNYAQAIRPKYINVQTTTSPGATERLQDRTGIPCVHSTTRGLHPNLKESIKTFTKHIGGHPEAVEFFADYFQKAGLKVYRHANAKTTELAHVLSNSLYGINIMFADEMAKVCRHYGVDYTEAVMAYNKTCNEGYFELGHPSKMRMILTPPQGLLLGHCVSYAPNQLPEEIRGPMLSMLAEKEHDPRRLEYIARGKNGK